jgi:hypothetical protein
VAANATGELVGLGAAAALGWVLFSTAQEPETLLRHILTSIAMIAVGGGEGIVVGLAQGWVVHRHLPDLRLREWVQATALGALVAWLLGMLPSTFLAAGAEASGAPAAEPSQPVVLGLAALMGGLVLGPILSFFQWRVLRHHVRGAGRWILANSAAWALGMPLIFAGADRAAAAGSPWASALIVLASLAAAGAVVGAVHGLWLVRLLREPLAQPLTP